MAQGILIHAGIDPRHAPRDIRVAREHKRIEQTTRPSAREIFAAVEHLPQIGGRGFLPPLPANQIHPRSTREGA